MTSGLSIALGNGAALAAAGAPSSIVPGLVLAGFGVVVAAAIGLGIRLARRAAIRGWHVLAAFTAALGAFWAAGEAEWPLDTYLAGAGILLALVATGLAFGMRYSKLTRFAAGRAEPRPDVASRAVASAQEVVDGWFEAYPLGPKGRGPLQAVLVAPRRLILLRLGQAAALGGPAQAGLVGGGLVAGALALGGAMSRQVEAGRRAEVEQAIADNRPGRLLGPGEGDVIPYARIRSAQLVPMGQGPRAGIEPELIPGGAILFLELADGERQLLVPADQAAKCGWLLPDRIPGFKSAFE